MTHPYSESCQDIGPLLSAYMDNELDKEESQRIALHLQTCTECKNHIAEYRKFSANMNEFFHQLTAPAWLEQSILDEIEGFRQTEQVSHLRTATSFSAFTMALLFLVMLLSPAGKVIWSLLTITSRVGHGIAVLLLHLILGNVWIIGAVVLCILVSIASIYMMKKMIQNTIVSQH